MKLFWRILSEIYSNLVVAGLKISPPNFLFYIPKKKLSCQYTATILADINFTDNERRLILEGLNDLHQFCNGIFELQILFVLDPEDHERVNNNYIILRVSPTHPSIVASDEKVESTTIGLCEYMENKTVRLYLVPERLTNPIMFRTTTIHELGHFLGLGHTERPSIMHKLNYETVLYPTRRDAEAFGKLTGLAPESFKYFKL